MIPPLTVKLIHHIYGALKAYLQHMVEIQKEPQKINSLKNKKFCAASQAGRCDPDLPFFVPLLSVFEK